MRVKQAFDITAIIGLTALAVVLFLIAMSGIGCRELQGGTVSERITWVSPGDDGMVGTAFAYTMKYSTDSVALVSDFENCLTVCDSVSGMPIPLIAGTAQEMIITGLEPNTVYFFTARTWDEARNFGGSNVLRIETPDTDSPADIELRHE
jgi:hypothetical protein